MTGEMKYLTSLLTILQCLAIYGSRLLLEFFHVAEKIWNRNINKLCIFMLILTEMMNDEWTEKHVNVFMNYLTTILARISPD